VLESSDVHFSTILSKNVRSVITFLFFLGGEGYFYSARIN